MKRALICSMLPFEVGVATRHPRVAASATRLQTRLSAALQIAIQTKATRQSTSMKWDDYLPQHIGKPNWEASLKRIPDDIQHIANRARL